MDWIVSLPVAGLSENLWWFVGIGLSGGLITGLLGLGGGVSITPLLLMMGVHPTIAIACQLNTAVGITFSSFLSFFRRNDVDMRLSALAIAGGVGGAFAALGITNLLTRHQIMGEVLRFGYVGILGLTGTLLLRQSLRALRKEKAGPPPTDAPPRPLSGIRAALQRLPGQFLFPRVNRSVSMIVPIVVGFLNAILTVILGIGNGVFMLPILTYVLRTNGPIVYGTTQMAGIVMLILSTILLTIDQVCLDLMLVSLLLIGGVVGAQVGVFLSYYISRSILGIVGALVIYGIGLKMMIARIPSIALGELNCDHLPFFWPKDPLLMSIAGVSLAIVLSLIVDWTKQVVQYGGKSSR